MGSSVLAVQILGPCHSRAEACRSQALLPVCLGNHAHRQVRQTLAAVGIGSEVDPDHSRTGLVVVGIEEGIEDHGNDDRAADEVAEVVDDCVVVVVAAAVGEVEQMGAFAAQVSQMTI